MAVKKYYDSNAVPVEPGYVFALLPEESKDVYENCIKSAANTLGLKCESFLDIMTPGNPLEDILVRIKRAEILIFDITGFNPNAMWELGIAMTIKEEEKIIVIRKSSESEFQTLLPFNIYQHRVSFSYNDKTLDELRDKLKNVMRDINRKKYARDMPIKNLEVRSLMEHATKLIEEKDWPIASLLFENMNKTEPGNWYILTRWGAMYRSKSEFEPAEKKFQEALECTDDDDDEAFIYIERALLFQMNHQYDTAEEWLKKAEKIDNKNKYLYIVWAELHEEQKDYHNAQAKIIKILKEIDENDTECQLRYEYYVKKILEKDCNMSFDEYKKNKRKFSARNHSESEQPFPFRGSELKLPWAITRQELDKNYIGKVVDGMVYGTHPTMGVFVKLSRDLTGLIHWKSLEPGFEDQYPKNKKVPVKIMNISIDGRTGRVRVGLTLCENDSNLSAKNTSINDINRNLKEDAYPSINNKNIVTRDHAQINKCFRHTKINSPKKCLIDQEIELSIQFTIEKPLETAVTQLIPIPIFDSKESIKLTLQLTAPGFHIDNPRKSMDVPANDDSEKVIFKMKPISIGIQIVEVEIYLNALRIGYFGLEIQVGEISYGQS